eukprot:768670-Hanusia_phi.AAC.5
MVGPDHCGVLCHTSTNTVSALPFTLSLSALLRQCRRSSPDLKTSHPLSSRSFDQIPSRTLVQGVHR